jgi:hypothetical protein
VITDQFKREIASKLQEASMDTSTEMCGELRQLADEFRKYDFVSEDEESLEQGLELVLKATDAFLAPIARRNSPTDEWVSPMFDEVREAFRKVRDKSDVEGLRSHVIGNDNFEQFRQIANRLTEEADEIFAKLGINDPEALLYEDDDLDED